MLRPPSPTRCLLILGLISTLLIFSLSSRFDLLNTPSNSNNLSPRQNVISLDTGTDKASTAPATSPASTNLTPSQTPTPTSPATPTATPTDQQPSSQPTQQPSDPNTGASAPSTSLPASTPTNQVSPTLSPSLPSDNPSQPNQASQIPVTSASLSVNADGETQTVIYTVTKGASASSASASASQAADDGSASSKSGKSTIIGLSVAGGIALVGIGVFVWWKFGRKRGGDEFDDNEAIQWPELNTHGDDVSKFPSNRSAGFETNSEINLTRPDSRAGSLAPSAAASSADLYSTTSDPYAVPPLPHLNPNQPYRDDPNVGGYYDPYSGAVPQTFVDGHDVVSVGGGGGGVVGGEAIPMTQINNSRSRSPGPQAAYDAGRRSPGPQAAYEMGVGQGRQSPGPQMAYGYQDSVGRSRSPGPGVGLGMGGGGGGGGRMSPGPQIAYGGRQSPGPQAAYGGRQSPGPQAAYGI